MIGSDAGWARHPAGHDIRRGLAAWRQAHVIDYAPPCPAWLDALHGKTERPTY
ncbi:hypothetical protein GCM10010399_14430 [Dactylosporangium fulvum]|uniref:Transposase n=1 Tax=Dactylosporangium fulvum TaxID=53359 RepID=A0ABY5VR98_9ACTN|nr:hypothetical protein [Dactylosporangium fulvum]UWP80273.1 hypothetical protein Dfulv_34640 [Dactylosporangium fulvum]